MTTSEIDRYAKRNGLTFGEAVKRLGRRGGQAAARKRRVALARIAREQRNRELVDREKARQRAMGID